MNARFQKRKERFLCLHCGTKVDGDGYTNHCPQCLWSRHVDVWPGDREHECRGMMEPWAVEQKHGRMVIVHRCTLCGELKRNRVQENDKRDALLELMGNADRE